MNMSHPTGTSNTIISASFWVFEGSFGLGGKGVIVILFVVGDLIKELCFWIESCDWLDGRFKFGIWTNFKKVFNGVFFWIALSIAQLREWSLPLLESIGKCGSTKLSFEFLNNVLYLQEITDVK